MTRTLCQFVPALLCLLAGVSASPARACTIAGPDPAFVGMPADGDESVPTDVVLYYEIPINAIKGPDGEVPGTFALEGPDGAAVEINLRRVNFWSFELTPESPLSPHTRYTLRGKWTNYAKGEDVEVEDTLSFETGAGALTEQPSPPVAVLSHYSLGDNEPGLCGPPPTGSCISVADDDASLEYTLIDEDGHRREPVAAHGSFQTELTGLLKDVEDECVSIRRRGLNGTYSEPVELCRADAKVTRFDKLRGYIQITCDKRGLTWADDSGEQGRVGGAVRTSFTKRTPASDDGCSVRRVGSGSSFGWAIMLLMLGTALRRRKTKPARR